MDGESPRYSAVEEDTDACQSPSSPQLPEEFPIAPSDRTAPASPRGGSAKPGPSVSTKNRPNNNGTVDESASRPTPWPVTATCSAKDYSAVARLGFPRSGDPAVRAAEEAAAPQLEADEAARERRWQDLSSGVPLLSGAAPSTVAALRQLARRPRQGGIPRSLRPVMWLTLTSMAVTLDENEYFCVSLLRRNGPVTGHVAATIAADLERTFPGHPYFCPDTDVGLYKLRNLLHAQCWRNPLVNYCQAFNYVAGFLLLVLDDEERAFWMLTHLLETLLPNDYYGESLVGARVDQAVLEHLVAARLPRVAAAVARISNFMISDVLPPWVMSLYVNTFPVETTLRVWDYLLTESEDVHERTGGHLAIALAVLKLQEPALLACEDAGDAMIALRQGTAALFDADLLVQTARSFGLGAAELHGLRRQIKPAVVEDIRRTEAHRAAMRERRLGQELLRERQASAAAREAVGAVVPGDVAATADSGKEEEVGIAYRESVTLPVHLRGSADSGPAEHPSDEVEMQDM